jgi:integrase
MYTYHIQTTSMSRTRKGSSKQLTVVKKKLYDVTAGLKSIETANGYKWHFTKFLKYSDVMPEQLLSLERAELEELIISYLQHMDKDLHLKPSTINTAMASIFHFCDMNDLLIARKKISKLCIPADEDSKEDRAYTRREIERLLKESDIRFRAVFLLLASTGMRIGAIHQLNIGDLTPISFNDTDGRQQKVYKIVVYGRSRKGRYYTFCTPECAIAIDEYLKHRQELAHEDITRSDSPLIREQFNIYNKRREGMLDISIPRRISQKVVEKIITRIVKESGVDKTNVALTHGLRKHCITAMKRAGVDFSDREYLVGHKHSRGLDVQYDRTTEEERLVEWSKAISNLTISDKHQLEVKLELLETKQAQMIEDLKQQVNQLQQKVYAKDRIMMGIDHVNAKPVAEGKKKEITKDEWLESLKR